jgi:TonB family protein
MLDIPPPPVFSSSAPERTIDIVTFEPGRVVCDGREIAGEIATPYATVSTRYASPDARSSIEYELSFAIDGEGRPRLIRRSGTIARSSGYIDTSDLMPSLAASRFPAAKSRDACRISYQIRTAPLSSAPMPALYELASRPSFQAVVPELRDRVRPANSTCPRGPGVPRRLNYPAFEQIPQAEGTWSWTFLAYDVNKGGRPVNIRVLGSKGNDALDRASVKALSANRYAPGPGYQGCTYHFYRTGPSGETSELLPADTPADTGEKPECQIDPKSIRTLLDGTAYPPPFSRRRIEGAAAISFDTAPWGAIGNVKIIASEPAEAFGEAARGAVVNAKVAESETGYRGCVRRIRFKLPPEPERQSANGL